MGETIFNSLAAGKPLARQHQFHTVVFSELGQTDHRNNGWNNTNAYFAEAVKRVFVCDDDVGRADKPQPTCERMAVHGRDDGFAAIHDLS